MSLGVLRRKLRRARNGLGLLWKSSPIPPRHQSSVRGTVAAAAEEVGVAPVITQGDCVRGIDLVMSFYSLISISLLHA
jgi:hypothetical protein